MRMRFVDGRTRRSKCIVESCLAAREGSKSGGRENLFAYDVVNSFYTLM